MLLVQKHDSPPPPGRSGSIDVVDTLLAAGADVTSVTNSGDTCRDLAANESHLKLVTHLTDVRGTRMK